MPTRNISLDILRAFAILLVLGRHLKPYFGPNLPLKRVVDIWWQGGWIGVDLFFVLSGFLISGLLFKEHTKSGDILFKRFFIRRGFKIYPAFYFMILISVLFPHPTPPSAPFAEIFFMQDYFRGIWGHTWSLGVEEKFYILLPLILILLSKINKSKDSTFKSIPLIFIIVSTTCLGFRILNPYYNPSDNLTYLCPFHLRLDSLFCGVAISYYYHYHAAEFKTTARKFKLPFLLIGLLFLLPAFIFSLQFAFIFVEGLTFFYLGSGLILIALIDHNFKPNLLSKGLSYIGSHSYSIYLWHEPIKSFLDYLSGKPFANCLLNWTNYSVIYLIASICFGIIISKIIEFPVLKLRDQLFPSLITPLA